VACSLVTRIALFPTENGEANRSQRYVLRTLYMF